VSFVVRGGTPADAGGLARLIQELGYDVSPADVAARLPRLFDLGLPPLLADAGQLIGCLTMGITAVLHRPRPVGRISMLVVAEAWRGRGVGRALVGAAEAYLAERGCGLIEVTSNVRRERAHAFYERLGYERTSFRFGKMLPSS
jgi:ribosomal protein S18 acetylase RimI-like enzyme